MLPANGVSISWTRFEHGNARGSLGPCSRRQQCSAPALLDRPAQQSAELSAQTFCTFPREFSSATRQRLEGRGPDPEPVLMIYSCTCDSPSLRAAPPDEHARGGPVGTAVGQLHRQAAASADGHISHDADRLASRRLRRAAAARDLRSAGTAAPMPKYISSGVWP